MRCIRCGHDSKYKDRTARRCPACKGEFALEPREGDIMTDVAFQHAIEAVSAQLRLKWGVEHLYYEVCRRKRPRNHVIAAGAGLVIAFVAAIVTGWLLAQIAVLLFLGLTLLAWHRSRIMTVQVSRPTFEHLWGRWRQAHGIPPGAIIRQERAETRPPAEPDVADYSFDRAVICDRARTADLLLANNFHFENNCAVLAIDGYPQGPFETVRTMLKRNPKLRVLALHDATPAGCRLAHKLAGDPAWFKDQAPVVDVGLRPGHAKPFRGLLLPATSGIVVEGDGTSSTEAAWLSQYVLELAAIRPEQVLKRLYRAMNRTDDSGDGGGDGSGGSWVTYDSASFGTEAGALDGGADSFG